MATTLEDTPKNLENEFLKGLRNQTVIGDVQNQVISKSKILPHITVLEQPGDVIKIVGLKSNRPKKFTWNYKEKEFSPGDAVVHKAEITDDDKLIFYTVFSEPIEKIAVGDKVGETVAKQANQVSYDIADFYDEEFVQSYVCDTNRYHKDAKVSLSADQLDDMTLIGKLAITTGFQMLSPSTLFNKKNERCNVSDTKKLLCFIDNSLYGAGVVSSIYKTPSPVLDALEKHFTVIPCNMVNDVKLSLIDSGAIYLWSSLTQRYLKLDEYVACHKLLDHVWRKWIFVDYRPAFCLVYDSSITTSATPKMPKITPKTPKKSILLDYSDLKDSSNTMSDVQAKEWKDKGFTYEQVKEWIDAGLKVDDAKFVEWLIGTKGGDYSDPLWLLNNAGSSSVKSIADLRTEAGI